MDISQYKNPPARLVGVTLTRGPDNHPRGAYYFSGKGSYVLIPNNGCLDTRYSITIIAWVYPEKPGPILHFNPKGWGVHLWMTKVNELFVRFVPRSGRQVKPVSSRKIKPRAWNFIAATYDQRTGLATLWRNGLPIVQRMIGRFAPGIATNYPAVIGRKPGDRREFRGRISCLQVYNFALTGRQIQSKMRRCFQPGKKTRAFSSFCVKKKKKESENIAVQGEGIYIETGRQEKIMRLKRNSLKFQNVSCTVRLGEFNM